MLLNALVMLDSEQLGRMAGIQNSAFAVALNATMYVLSAVPLFHLAVPLLLSEGT